MADAIRVIFGFALLALLSSGGITQVICIDPGHPSENGVGSRGKTLTEVGVAWSVAKRLETLLTKEGYQVILTKSSENEMVTNRRRAEIANKAKADLMIRLHCDAAQASGFSVYYPRLEGRVDRVAGPSADVRRASQAAAEKFHPTLVKALQGKHPDRGLMTDRSTAIGRRQGALTGSIYSKVPVVLVELAVLSNSKDEAFLQSKEGFEALCQALASGVLAAVPRRG